MTMLIVNILSFYKETVNLQFSNVNCFKEANFNVFKLSIDIQADKNLNVIKYNDFFSKI